jgi:biopolymer transport protein ExbD
MAMNIGSHNGTNDAIVDMNTTPLIDVMLVLLVMLIVTIPMQTHAVKLDMPSDVPQAPAPAVHSLAVDFDGTMTWDGATVPTLAALDDHFTAIAHEREQAEIHLTPNRLASYDVVARILADAQRLGVKKIGFAGEEQYSRRN